MGVAFKRGCQWGGGGGGGSFDGLRLIFYNFED